jgi:hypothetical protein
VVRHTFSAKDESYRAIQHKDTCIEIVRVRLAMPLWFDLTFANLITLLSKAGFKLSPIHRPAPPAAHKCPPRLTVYTGRLQWHKPAHRALPLWLIERRLNGLLTFDRHTATKIIAKSLSVCEGDPQVERRLTVSLELNQEIWLPYLRVSTPFVSDR